MKRLGLIVTCILFLCTVAAAQTPQSRLVEVKEGDLKFEPFTIPFESQNVTAEFGAARRTRKSEQSQVRNNSTGVCQIEEHFGPARIPCRLS
jgi:hypothetical protein